MWERKFYCFMVDTDGSLFYIPCRVPRTTELVPSCGWHRGTLIDAYYDGPSETLWLIDVYALEGHSYLHLTPEERNVVNLLVTMELRDNNKAIEAAATEKKKREPCPFKCFNGCTYEPYVGKLGKATASTATMTLIIASRQQNLRYFHY